MRFDISAAVAPARAGRRATGFLLAVLPLATLALAGCSINVNDDGRHAGMSHPRGATDLCRREVWRSYHDDFKIAYDLPELTTTGTTQTVVQPFTLTPERGRGAAERRTVRCTVTDGVLTEMRSL